MLYIYPYHSGLPFWHLAIMITQCQWNDPAQYGQMDRWKIAAKSKGSTILCTSMCFVDKHGLTWNWFILKLSKKTINHCCNYGWLCEKSMIQWQTTRLINVPISQAHLQIITHHWFRKWLGAKWATSHFLNQYWLHSLTFICGTRGKWIN